MTEINWTRAAHRIGTCQYQLSCQLKCVLVRAFEHECAGIGQDGGVKACGNLCRNLYSRLLRQLVHHLSGRHCFRVNPVHVRKRATASVMINVDEELVFKTFKPRALNAVAFEQYRRVIVAIHPLSVKDFFRKRQ